MFEETNALEKQLLEKDVLTPDDLVHFNELNHKIRDYNNLMTRMMELNTPIPNAQAVMTKISIAQTKLRTHLLSLKRSQFIRQRPAVLWLYGKPGCGKSTFVKSLVKMLGTLVGKELSVFSRTKTKYWDGYTNNDVVVYNDIFAAESMYSDVNEAEEFQNVVDTCFFPCAMAQAEDKGWPFTSQFVIVCSNHLSDPYLS